MSVFFMNDTASTEIATDRHTLSLDDALPISRRLGGVGLSDVVEPRPIVVGRAKRKRELLPGRVPSDEEIVMQVLIAAADVLQHGCAQVQRQIGRAHV